MKTSLSHLRAIGYALLGFTLWVFSDATMKMAGESHLPSYEVVAYLGFFGVVFMFAKASYTKTVKTLWPSRPLKTMVRGLLALTINLFNTVALAHLPLTLFFVAVFTAPIVTSLMAAFSLREHLSPLRIAAILIGFIGVIIAIDPFSTTGHGDWLGYAAATGSVIFFSISSVWLRRMTQDETADSLAFFTAFVELVPCAALMLFHAEPVTFRLFIILMLMGFFCVAGNICNYIALRHTTAATVSQFHYTQIITGALLGYILWNEIPTLHLVTGMLVITGAGLVVAAQSHAPKSAVTAPTNPT